MTFFTADELQLFVDPIDFGTRAVLKLAKTGEMRAIVGGFTEKPAVFDPNRWPGSQYQMQAGAKFSSAGPRLECKSDAVKGVRGRDEVDVEVDGEPQRFRVQDVQRSSTGLTLLILIEPDDA